MTKTAQKAYTDVRREVEEKGRKLAQACAAHAAQQAKRAHDWGYVGDLTHLSALLDECLQAVGG
jgi:hypothetical protein